MSYFFGFVNTLHKRADSSDREQWRVLPPEFPTVGNILRVIVVTKSSGADLRCTRCNGFSYRRKIC